MEGDVLEREIEYHKKVAGLANRKLAPVRDYVVQRYRVSKNWRFFAKEAVFHFIKEYVAGKEGLTACEFGCGEGMNACQVALAFPSVAMIGIDISQELIDVARRNASINGIETQMKFVVADVEEYGLDNESIDIMLALNVMHHVQVEPALEKLMRSIKPGGMVIFLEPIAYSPMLQCIRDHVPVKRNASPDEHQLTETETDALIRPLTDVSIVYFSILGRLSRLFSNRNCIDKGHTITKYALIVLRCVDLCLLRVFPGMRRYAGQILIVGYNAPRDCCSRK